MAAFRFVAIRYGIPTPDMATETIEAGIVKMNLTVNLRGSGEARYDMESRITRSAIPMIRVLVDHTTGSQP
ncbi:hypothetical protein [Nocardia stercoris]|uniref:hypothetical protein n=1 Tax=Nocardia stercoris TaxID=2483361 RepID=UPI0011C4A843|nr:hypothetical protein [Nocardia stercoris]